MLVRLLPVLLLLLTGCATAPNCALVPLASMPLTLHRGLLFVTAGIGGRPVRLIVDTGSERTVLTEAAVARLGLARSDRVTQSVGIGGISANRNAVIPGLTLGQTRFPVWQVPVGGFRLGDGAGGAADGLLGADILLAFDMDIDEQNERLTLYRVRTCADAAPPWRGPVVAIDGLGARRDRLLVPITLDGVAGMAVLDTGAQYTAIGMSLARRLGLTRAALAADPSITVHGASPQPIAVPLHRFHELDVGTARIMAPELAVLPGERAVGDALLGGNFLRGRRVWLSFATQRLILSTGATEDLARAP